VKKLAVLLVLLAFAADGLAQVPTPGPAQAPVQVAQAGGAAEGATVPAASTGAASTTVAIIAVAAAGVAAVVGYNSTTSASHH
jgi:hypothetical protein